jgi:hypothetical protein
MKVPELCWARGSRQRERERYIRLSARKKNLLPSESNGCSGNGADAKSRLKHHIWHRPSRCSPSSIMFTSMLAGIREWRGVATRGGLTSQTPKDVLETGAKRSDRSTTGLSVINSHSFWFLHPRHTGTITWILFPFTRCPIDLFLLCLIITRSQWKQADEICFCDWELFDFINKYSDHGGANSRH